MSTEIATDFLLLTWDHPALEDIFAITDPNKLVELGKIKNYEFTIENLREAIKELDNKPYIGKQQESIMTVSLGGNPIKIQKLTEDGSYQDLEKPGALTEPQLIVFNYLSEEIKNWAKA